MSRGLINYVRTMQPLIIAYGCGCGRWINIDSSRQYDNDEGCLMQFSFNTFYSALRMRLVEAQRSRSNSTAAARTGRKNADYITTPRQIWITAEDTTKNA